MKSPRSVESEIRTQRWRRTFLHPAVLAPLGMACVCFGVALWSGLFGGGLIGGGLARLLGVGSLVAAAGAAIYRATLGAGSIIQQSQFELLQKKRRKHLEYLRQLRRKMRTDRDPRTGAIVTKLRTIYEQMDASSAAAAEDYCGVLPELHEQASDLYQSCLGLLEHSYDLWETGRSLTERENRESLEQERETILCEVQQSVEHLDRTMDELRKAVLRGKRDPTGDNELALAEQTRLRDELSYGIDAARAVERRMCEFEEELDLRRRI